jgi:hypothetical protein
MAVTARHDHQKQKGVNTMDTNTNDVDAMSDLQAIKLAMGESLTGKEILAMPRDERHVFACECRESLRSANPVIVPSNVQIVPVQYFN